MKKRNMMRSLIFCILIIPYSTQPMFKKVQFEPSIILISELKQLVQKIDTLANSIKNMSAPKIIIPEIITPDTPGVASIWSARAEYKKAGSQGTPPDVTKMIESYVADINGLEKNNALIPKIAYGSATATNIYRITSYNVHGWRDTKNRPSIVKITDIIETINPHTIILQEVLIDPSNPTNFPTNIKNLQESMTDIGFAETSFAAADNPNFGNLISTKLPFRFTSGYSNFFTAMINTNNQRSYILREIELPNKEKLSIYASHLEVANEKVATEQMEELLEALKTDTNKYKLIGADFNSVRAKDYDYKVKGYHVWNDLFNARITNKDPQTKVLETLKKAGFKNALDIAQKMNGTPRFTNWAGTMIDFFYVSPEWDLPVDFYVFYSEASDHLPIILDIHLPRQ